MGNRLARFAFLHSLGREQPFHNYASMLPQGDKLKLLKTYIYS
jgi:hypothetical protein